MWNSVLLNILSKHPILYIPHHQSALSNAVSDRFILVLLFNICHEPPVTALASDFANLTDIFLCTFVTNVEYESLKLGLVTTKNFTN